MGEPRMSQERRESILRAITKAKVAVCPCCDGQGDVVTARIDKTEEVVYLCDECDTLWQLETDISSKPGVCFSQYVKPLGLKGLWTEITLLGENNFPTT
jgi:hypothetical protein